MLLGGNLLCHHGKNKNKYIYYVYIYFFDNEKFRMLPIGISLRLIFF